MVLRHVAAKSAMLGERVPLILMNLKGSNL